MANTQDLLNMLQALTQQVTNLTAQVAQQVANPPQAVVNMPAPAPVVRMPTIAAPPIFKGEMGETEVFLRAIQIYMATHAAEFSSAETRVMFALSYIQGGIAQPWKEQILERYVARETAVMVALQNQDPLPADVFASWDDFKAEFNRRFADPNPMATAIAQLETLRQGNSTCDEFTVKFQNIASRTGYNDAALIELYKKRLNNKLLEKLYTLPIMPTTLQRFQNNDGWYDWAQRLDRQWREAESYRRIPGLGHAGATQAMPQTAQMTRNAGYPNN